MPNVRTATLEPDVPDDIIIAPPGPYCCPTCGSLDISHPACRKPESIKPVSTCPACGDEKSLLLYVDGRRYRFECPDCTVVAS